MGGSGSNGVGVSYMFYCCLRFFSVVIVLNSVSLRHGRKGLDRALDLALLIQASMLLVDVLPRAEGIAIATRCGSALFFQNFQTFFQFLGSILNSILILPPFLPLFPCENTHSVLSCSCGLFDIHPSVHPCIHISIHPSIIEPIEKDKDKERKKKKIWNLYSRVPLFVS